MSRKLCASLFALALAAVACGQSKPNFANPLGASPGFVPQVVDFLDDVGYSPSVAVGADGSVHVAYLGFNPAAVPGSIPPPRPLTAPTLPAVLTSDLSTQGIWSHGAVKQDAKVTRTDQVAMALDSKGAEHVVWTEGGELHYGSGVPGPTAQFGDETVAKSAGIHGSPTASSVAVDKDGNAWVAFEVGASVEVATNAGGKWKTQTVATTSPCGGCPPPRTSIAVGSAGPVVAFADPSTKTPMVATENGNGWKTESIITTGAGGGYGISLALDGKGNPYVSFYDLQGEVVVASPTGGSNAGAGRWRFDTTGFGTSTLSRFADGLKTSIAVDQDGHVHLAWYDAGRDRIGLASNSGGSDKQVPTVATSGGESPSLAITADGSQTYVAWFDRVNADLDLGAAGVSVPPLAVPSPSPSPAPSATGSAAACKPATIQLDAEPGAGTSGFKQTTLSAPASKGFTVCFVNDDPSVTHNFAIFSADPSKQPTAKNFFTGTTIIGPATTDYSVSSLAPGSYFYRCDVHPTVMFGTLKVS